MVHGSRPNATGLTVASGGSVGIGTTNPITGTRLTLPQENDAVTPTLAFGDGDTGFYENADDQISITTAATQRFIFTSNFFRGANANSAFLENDGVLSASDPTMGPVVNDSDTGISSGAADQLSLIAGGVEMWRFVEDTTDYSFTTLSVGIGDTTPDFLLDIESSSSASTTLSIDNTSTGDAQLLLRNNGVDEWFIGYDDSQSDVFRITDPVSPSPKARVGVTASFS